jgi:pimeloyl-ACP methyl ester carboxylesterase
MRVLFLHGAGKAGPDAWPVQSTLGEDEWEFLARAETGDDPGRDAVRLLERLEADGPAHLVAHSYGGNAAVLAAQRAPYLVASLALLEPACFDLARGKSVVEEHITAMTPVFAVADDPSVSAREFSRRFAAAMGSPPPDLPDDDLAVHVARLRAMAPPWDTGLDPAAGLPVRTVVVSGGWNPMYEQVADALAEFGARRVTVTGSGHRVQDVDGFTDLLREVWTSGEDSPDGAPREACTTDAVADRVRP